MGFSFKKFVKGAAGGALLGGGLFGAGGAAQGALGLGIFRSGQSDPAKPGQPGQSRRKFGPLPSESIKKQKNGQTQTQRRTSPITSSEIAARDQRIEDDTKKSFEVLRQRANQKSQADIQQSTDAIRRRFAALGGTGSGSEIKLELQAIRDAQERASQAQENIDLAEIQELQRRREFERPFQARSKELENQREFARERAEVTDSLRERMFQFEQDTKLKGLDLAQQQLELDAMVTNFNKAIAQQEANKKSGLFTDLFGDLF